MSLLGAVNAQPRTVIDYGEDPTNPARALARAAMVRLHGFLVPVPHGGDFDPETQYRGYGPEVQSFAGLASSGATSVVTNDGAYPELSSAVLAGPMGDPARRILADRLRRRSSL